MSFVIDTFTDADGTLIPPHTGETGATWTKPSYVTPVPKIFTNRACGSATTGSLALSYASGVPSGADQDVTVHVHVVDLTTNYTDMIRARQSTTVDTGYRVGFDPTDQKIHLIKRVSGSDTDLGSFSVSGWTNGSDHTVIFQCRDAGKTVNIDGTDRITSADNAITAAGRMAIAFFTVTGDPTLHGLHITDITADDFVASSLTVTGPNSAASLPANHNGNIVATLVGTGTAWDGTTVFTPTGVSGWAKVSQSVTNATHATVTLSCPAVASPPAGATGTLTITESVTGGAIGTIGVVTPTLTPSPSSVGQSISIGVSFTGVATLWQGDNPQITVSGVAGVSIGASTETDNTHSSATLTTGSTSGTATLTDPSTGAQASVTVTSIIGVSNPNLFPSPGNWYKSGSTYLQTNNWGATLQFGFAGTSLAINVDVSPLVAASIASGDYPVFQVSIDGGVFSSITLTSASATISLATGLSAGNHTCLLRLLHLNVSQASDLWATPADVLRLTGFALDAGSGSVAPTLKSKRAIIYGDSITCGWAAGPSATNDASYAFCAYLGEALDAELGVIAYGEQGWSESGWAKPLWTSGDAANTAWDKYDANHSRLVGGLFSPALDFIFIVHGTNDGLAGALDATVTARVAGLLPDLRAAAPSTHIFVYIPFGGFKRVAITAGVTADSLTHLRDLGTALQVGLDNTGASRRSSDGIHPDPRGHMEIASLIAADAMSVLAAGTGGGGTAGSGHMGLGL